MVKYMSNLFFGKITIEQQYLNNYYQCGGPNYKSWIGQLQVGDYVLGNNYKYGIRNLLKCIDIIDSGEEYTCRFDVIKTFNPELKLSSNIARSKHLKIDLNILNKIYKSTNKLSFHKLDLENSEINIEQIDFSETRDFYCVLEKFKENVKKNLKNKDIVIIFDDLNELNIIDIVEFVDNQFLKYESLWNLYETKNKEDEKYSIRELFKYSSSDYDSAPKKFKYLSKLIESLENDNYFVINQMVGFYDNVLVGRKKTTPSKENSTEDEIEETRWEIEEDEIEYQKYANILKFTPNLILYGPPGTGKTYSLSKIIEAKEKQEGSLLNYYDIEKEGRVKFITFHQSFSYEEFIEGLRPYMNESNSINYRVEPGILKSFIEKQSIQLSTNKKINDLKKDIDISNENVVYRISLGAKAEKNIYEFFKTNNKIGIRHGDPIDFFKLNDEQKNNANSTLKRFAEQMNIGDFVCVFNDSETIRLVGIVTSDYYFDKSNKFEYFHTRNVTWIENFESSPLNILSMNNNSIMTNGALNKLNFNVSTLINTIENLRSDNRKKPLYLIIDEINRGNISKIFGELITLIEKDKRDTLQVVLPYSKQKFSIPSNLFILATMNTSDRSIALLDTALRRRFAFIELTPNLNLVETINPVIGKYVSPSSLLSYINSKIEKYIDRDHLIGHSYFVEESMVVEDLYFVWYYQIIPLLIEYFYFDYTKLHDVIKDFIDNSTNQIIYYELKSNGTNISLFEEKLLSLYK